MGYLGLDPRVHQSGESSARGGHISKQGAGAVRQVLGQAAHLWTRTSLRPADVDLALLYDGFTFNAVSWLEGLGFCGLGEAQDWLDGGRRIALDGVGFEVVGIRHRLGKMTYGPLAGQWRDVILIERRSRTVGTG